MSDEQLLSLLDSVHDSGAKTLSIMRTMGIAHTANTPVGDAMLRGVSGGACGYQVQALLLFSYTLVTMPMGIRAEPHTLVGDAMPRGFSGDGPWAVVVQVGRWCAFHDEASTMPQHTAICAER